MPQSKSFNDTCLEVGLKSGFISKLKDGRLWIDAGLVEHEFYLFCNRLRKTLNKEALEALQHGLQYVEESSATVARNQYTNTINKLKGK